MKRKLGMGMSLFVGFCLLTAGVVDAGGTKAPGGPPVPPQPIEIAPPLASQDRERGGIPPVLKGLTGQKDLASRREEEKKRANDLQSRYLAIQKKLADHLTHDDLTKRILEGEKQLSEINAKQALKKLELGLEELLKKYPGTEAAKKAEKVREFLRAKETLPVTSNQGTPNRPLKRMPPGLPPGHPFFNKDIGAPPLPPDRSNESKANGAPPSTSTPPQPDVDPNPAPNGTLPPTSKRTRSNAHRFDQSPTPY